MISFSRYINIVSGVGAGASVAKRQLILRLVTQNTTLPPGIVLEFLNATSVGSYFGTNSEEYLRALAYFSFVSKSIKSPTKISFTRWVNASIAPMVVGDAISKTLSQWAAISAGTLTVNDGNTAYSITGINTTASTSLGDVAAAVQTRLRAAAGSTQLATCTVTFNTNTNQFVLTGTVTGSGALTVTPTALSTDVSTLLGWGTGGTVYVAGQAADTADVAVSKSAAISNNFGSVAFVGVTLTNTQIVAVATWVNSQNNMYLYAVPTTLANLATLYALVSGMSGTGLILLANGAANDYAEQSPCEILAATDYTAKNGVQQYMYYQFANRNTVVSDDTTANTADASRGNYIGVTQSAGQQLAFFQRGVLCGGSTAATDMNVYANEMWLKSDISANLMSMFLNMPTVPTNDIGRSMVIGQIQTSVNAGTNNGTIIAGKKLTTTQQQYISQVSGDPNAWRQVQTIGYWLDVQFQSQVNAQSGLTEWYAVYTLIYSKGDGIRTVQGSDIMM